MVRLHRRATVVALTAGAAVSVLAACGPDKGMPVAVQPSATAPVATSSPSPTPSPSASPTVSDASPFSGRPGGLGRPVLVVKYDNTPNAQPHSGLTSADLVYIEQVEGGLTRIAAVFATTLPTVVGPVRSARISDIDLLAQFGKPAFAYSGSQQRMHPVIAAASLYDVSGDKGPKGWFRDGSRPAPYNFMGHPAVLLTRAPHATGAADIGFVFDPTAFVGGASGRDLVARWPASKAEFVWNAAGHRYDIKLNGRPARATEGGIQHATTVVVQYVRVHPSPYKDRHGGVTPMMETVGHGTGWVLRDGRAIKATWSRPVATGGTTWTDGAGQQVAFAPGQVWVALVNVTTPVSLR